MHKDKADPVDLQLSKYSGTFVRSTQLLAYTGFGEWMAPSPFLREKTKNLVSMKAPLSRDSLQVSCMRESGSLGRSAGMGRSKELFPFEPFSFFVDFRFDDIRRKDG